MFFLKKNKATRERLNRPSSGPQSPPPRRQPPPRLTGRAGGGEEQRPVPLEGRLQHGAARPHSGAGGVSEAEAAGRQRAATAARRVALDLGLRPHGGRRLQHHRGRGRQQRQQPQRPPRRHVAPRSLREGAVPPAAGGTPAKWQLGPAGPGPPPPGHERPHSPLRRPHTSSHPRPGVALLKQAPLCF